MNEWNKTNDDGSDGDGRSHVKLGVSHQVHGSLFAAVTG